MPERDIIVLGTSMGGVEALSRLVRHLPHGLPAALFVVCHFPSTAISRLPQILSRAGPMPAVYPQDGEPIRPGRIVVAPPDHHLLVNHNTIHLTRGPRENTFRPSIDVLFRSAARYHGNRVIGVLLTGALSDGVAGLLAVRSAGGAAVIQDPADAAVSWLPQNALDIAGADHVVPVAEMPALLVRLVHQCPDRGSNMIDPIDAMPATVEKDMAAQQQGDKRGQLSVFTCPECGGALWQVDEEQLVRFRCHVGHSYMAEHLMAEQSENLEAALWTAVRIFKERAILSRELAERERNRGETRSAERFVEQAQQAQQYGEVIQKLLQDGTTGPVPHGSERAADAAQPGAG